MRSVLNAVATWTIELPLKCHYTGASSNFSTRSTNAEFGHFQDPARRSGLCTIFMAVTGHDLQSFWTPCHETDKEFDYLRKILGPRSSNNFSDEKTSHRGPGLIYMKASVTGITSPSTMTSLSLSFTCASANNSPHLGKAGGRADWLLCAGSRRKLQNLAPQILTLFLCCEPWEYTARVALPPKYVNQPQCGFILGLAIAVLHFRSALGFSGSISISPMYVFFSLTVSIPTKGDFKICGR